MASNDRPDDTPNGERPEQQPTPSPSSPPPDPTSSSAVTDTEASSSTSESRSAYNDLRRLIPALAAELDQLRASLREHNVWLQRYGHSVATAAAASGTTTTAAAPADDLTFARGAGPSASASDDDGGGGGGGASGNSDPELPAYTASDLPPYTGGPNSVSPSTSTTEEVRARREQLTEWLREGEDVLREYSGRFAQLREELGIASVEDVLGTWNEASPDNALPDYRVIEDREDRMVGGVGEVPPPYLGGGIAGKGKPQR